MPHLKKHSSPGAMVQKLELDLQLAQNGPTSYKVGVICCQNKCYSEDIQYGTTRFCNCRDDNE